MGRPLQCLTMGPSGPQCAQLKGSRATGFRMSLVASQPLPEISMLLVWTPFPASGTGLFGSFIPSFIQGYCACGRVQATAHI